MNFYPLILREICIHKNELEDYCKRCSDILSPWTNHQIEKPKPVENQDVQVCDEEKAVEEIKQVLEKAARIKAKSALEDFKKKEVVQSKAAVSRENKTTQKNASNSSGKVLQKNKTQPDRPSSSSSTMKSTNAQTTKSRFKPAHMTAPYRTQANLPIKRQSRYTGAAKKKASSPQHSSSVVTKWVNDKTLHQTGSQSQNVSCKKPDDQPSVVCENRTGLLSQRNANAQPDREYGSDHTSLDLQLHRSISLESISSSKAETSVRTSHIPQTTMDCASSDGTPARFSLKTHAKLLQIPREMSRQYRQHADLMEDAVSYIQAKPCRSGQSFLSKMESYMNSRYMYRVRLLTLEFQDCYRKLRQFRTIVQYLDVESCTVDQLCWCRLFFSRIVETYTLLLHRYQTIVDELDSKQDIPETAEEQRLNKANKELHTRVHTWFKQQNCHAHDSVVLSPFDVYKTVGCDVSEFPVAISRSVRSVDKYFNSYGYSSKRKADKFLDLWQKVFEKWKILELQRNLSRNKMKLFDSFRQSVKHEKSPCAVLRQLSGIFCDKLPVTLKQEVDDLHQPS